MLCCRVFFSSRSFNKPKSGHELVRTGGIASLFRLPTQESGPEGLDACFVGVPFDAASSYRPGARLGPRAIRSESRLIRYQNPTGALPFASIQVADIGDVPVIPQNVERTMLVITDYYHKIVQANCIPLTMGGDHSITYPILRSLSKKHGPVALVQVDSHPDLCNTVSGERYSSGTVMRRVVEDGLVDAGSMIQIGLRGSVESADVEMQFEWAQKQVHTALLPLLRHYKGRATVAGHQTGAGLPVLVQVSVSADGEDQVPTGQPSHLLYSGYEQHGAHQLPWSRCVTSRTPPATSSELSCACTGTPEVGGLTPIQAMEIVQGLRGINLVGADLTEVSRPLSPPML